MENRCEPDATGMAGTSHAEYLRRQQSNRHLWDNRARAYTGRAVTCRTDWVAAASLGFLRRAAKDRRRVLEVGCGDGNLLGRLNAGATRWGLDQSGEMLAVAKRTTDPSITYVHGDATSLPFRERAFDLVYTSRCLINIQDPQRQLMALRELVRVTEPGGTVIVIENFAEGRRTLERACKRFRLAPLAPIGSQRPLDFDSVLHVAAQSGCTLVRWHHYRLASCLYYLGLGQLLRRRGLAAGENCLRPLLASLARVDSLISTRRPIVGKDTTLEFVVQ